jgi:chromate transporter
MSVSWRDAFRFWLKLGFISFGGPAGQIATMHEELVVRRRWISEHRFLHALNYCMVLPGPEAQQLATYIGWLLHGTWGGIVAGALFVLPAMLILIGLSWTYLAWGDTALVSAIFYGIKPAVVAIVVAAAWRIGWRTLRTPLLAGIAGVSLLTSALSDVPFPAIVLAAAAVGLVAGRIWSAQVPSGGGHGAAKPVDGMQAVIDDHTPAPDHARRSMRRLLGFAGAGITLWALAMAITVLAGAEQPTLARMGWFFTKAALLTIGGAYAVLPYVYDAAVAQYGWLTAAQMMDGLALGETTPGPLIMIVTFVGFVGGWQQGALGPDSLVVGGLAGALVATFFTFLPSFLFILVGGPLVEATRGEVRIAAPLTAVTAAVVGVILNLALTLGRHAIWPAGAGEPVDWFAAAVALAAGVALIRFKVGVMTLVGCSAAAGLAYRGLGAIW